MPNISSPFSKKILIQELSITIKNNLEAIKITSMYMANPYDQRNSNNQWISTIFHEHSKSTAMIREEIDYMICILMSQSIMQLGVPEI